MKRYSLFILSIIVSICLFASCSNTPSGSTTISETNHARNQIFDITFVGNTKSNKGITSLGTTATASSGNVYQVLVFNVKSLSNSVEYIMDTISTISLELANGHRYFGHYEAYSFMPEATGDVYVYFETLSSENLNGAKITFKWDSLYSSASPCIITLSNSTESTLSVENIKGMYMLTDPIKGGLAGGYCCLKEDGKYWQVIEGVQSEGTWVFAGGKNLAIMVNGRNTTYEFRDDAYLIDKTIKPNYSSAVRIISLTDYTYGMYEGSDLQIRNTFVGSWYNEVLGLGYVFDSNYTAKVCTFNSETNSWDEDTGYTWSFSKGKLTIVKGTTYKTSCYVAQPCYFDKYYHVYEYLLLDEKIFVGDNTV